MEKFIKTVQELKGLDNNARLVQCLGLRQFRSEFQLREKILLLVCALALDHKADLNRVLVIKRQTRVQ